MAILINTGCKVNQYEGYCLEQRYARDEKVVIINTCCVTREAEIKSLKRLRQARRDYPDHRIVVTGCMCSLPGKRFGDKVEILTNEQRNREIATLLPARQRSRYFLKIQDGCIGQCSYCVVSRIRTVLYSKPIAVVKKEIEHARHLGYNEIVLVGANIGLYGAESGGSLVSLLREIERIRDLPRIRLSSLEPSYVTRELHQALKALPFCRHFHIPIQSACDSILRGMARPYTRQDLQRLVDIIVHDYADVCLAADVIVGFPGEDEKAFLDTAAFIQGNPFVHIHVFPYSPRPITPAYKLGDPIGFREKKNRLWKLRNIIRDKNHDFRQRLVGQVCDVIIEKHKGVLTGLTDHYIRVLFEPLPDKAKEKELRLVRMLRATRDDTWAAPVNA